MTLTFGTTQFDRIHYDREADVLYLNVEGVEAVRWEESPEGHFLRFDASGNLCGATLTGVGHLIESEGTVKVTVPCAQELNADDLGMALAL